MADPVDLLKQVMKRQAEFERELVDRTLGPARGALELVGQATESMRAQALAFRAASASLSQVADLLDQQVELLDGLRDPVSALRAAGDKVRKGGSTS